MDETNPESRLHPSFPGEGATEAETSNRPQSHDASRRALFAHPQVIRDLIVGYVDEPWVEDIDFDSLRRISASFVTPALRQRIADVIWTARWRDRDLYIVILIEFQFLLLEEQRLPVDLDGPANLMAAIAALEQGGSSVEEFAEAIVATSRWLEQSSDDLRQIFYAWVTRVLAASIDSDLPLGEIDDLGDLKDMLEERIAGWKDQWYAEGIEAGVEKGIEQGVARGRRMGEAQILGRLMRVKFRQVSEQVQGRLDSADDDELLRWADRVLTADTIDEVFDD